MDESVASRTQRLTTARAFIPSLIFTQYGLAADRPIGAALGTQTALRRGGVRRAVRARNRHARAMKFCRVRDARDPNPLAQWRDATERGESRSLAAGLRRDKHRVRGDPLPLEQWIGRTSDEPTQAHHDYNVWSGRLPTTPTTCPGRVMPSIQQIQTTPLPKFDQVPFSITVGAKSRQVFCTVL